MGLKDFVSNMRSSVAEFRDRVVTLDEQVSACDAELAEVVNLPLPFEDFRAWAVDAVRRRLDDCGDRHGRKIVARLMGNEGTAAYVNPRGLSPEGFESLYFGEHDASGTFLSNLDAVGWDLPIAPDLLLFALSSAVTDQLLPQLLDRCLKPHWPRQVGLKRGERRIAIAKIREKRQALVDERDALTSELGQIAAL